MQRWIFASVLLVSLAACRNEDASESSTSAVAPNETTAVVGTLWQWRGTVTPAERIDVSEPARYTLRFTADGNAEIQFDCNRGRGSYELEGNRLSFGPLMSTRMACAPDSQDALFMDFVSALCNFSFVFFPFCFCTCFF